MLTTFIRYGLATKTAAGCVVCTKADGIRSRCKRQPSPASFDTRALLGDARWGVSPEGRSGDQVALLAARARTKTQNHVEAGTSVLNPNAHNSRSARPGKRGVPGDQRAGGHRDWQMWRRPQCVPWQLVLTCGRGFRRKVAAFHHVYIQLCRFCSPMDKH